MFVNKTSLVLKWFRIFIKKCLLLSNFFQRKDEGQNGTSLSEGPGIMSGIGELPNGLPNGLPFDAEAPNEDAVSCESFIFEPNLRGGASESVS